MAAKMRVDRALCTGCGQCVSACPEDAIVLKDGYAFIDEDLCTGCEACRQACPVGAIYPVAQGEVVVAQRQPAVESQSRASSSLSVLRSMARSPALQALVGFVGTQVVPRVVDALMQRSPSDMGGSRAPEQSGDAGVEAIGRRGGQRRRHRGGRN